jgi:hypothetical protein
MQAPLPDPPEQPPIEPIEPIEPIAASAPAPAVAQEAAVSQAPAVALPPAVPEVTRHSKLAVVSGYTAIIPFTWAFFLFPYAYSKFPAWMGWKWIAITSAFTVAVGIYPSFLLAAFGHSRIRRNPKLTGMSHVWFAYVSCAMVFGVLVTALLLQALRK